MFIIHRTVVPGINALFVTVGLLFLMYQLVKVDVPELAATPSFKLPSITMDHVDEELQLLIPQPDKIVEPKLAPKLLPPIIERNPEEIESNFGDIGYSPPKQKGLLLPENPQLALTLGFPPSYPRAAISKGIEGYAIVGFSVAASGAVFDAFIIESAPGEVFNRSSLKAIEKFKYNPKKVGGKPVSVDGQRYQFTYKLDNS